MTMTKTVSIILACVACTLPSSVAFVPAALATTKTTTRLAAGVEDGINSRRDVLGVAFTAAVAAAAVTVPSAAWARDEYLSEPTDEFKESERQRTEFRKAQIVIKVKMTATFAQLTTVSKTEDEIVADLKELRKQVQEVGGMPLGIKKDDLVKVVRSVKAKGFWPTSCEYAYVSISILFYYRIISKLSYEYIMIAICQILTDMLIFGFLFHDFPFHVCLLRSYQGLITEIAYQQSPNKDKDVANPL
uniref:PSI-F n=1 Tax=Attheya septentrionalis TaxID=420275 RepID=A0A7S2XNC7_9STRA|mmetsp:Transcript_22593/g.40774  ORF Transcript_22593/g.40774 Transcript_22593/m.40774 type:complete len:246 (+) Transcript_22593:138-875(+)